MAPPPEPAAVPLPVCVLPSTDDGLSTHTFGTDSGLSSAVKIYQMSNFTHAISEKERARLSTSARKSSWGLRHADFPLPRKNAATPPFNDLAS